jgi:hypothetical protein
MQNHTKLQESGTQKSSESSSLDNTMYSTNFMEWAGSSESNPMVLHSLKKDSSTTTNCKVLEGGCGLVGAKLLQFGVKMASHKLRELIIRIYSSLSRKIDVN